MTKAVVAAVGAGAVVGGLSVWPGGLPVLWAVALAVPAALVAVLGVRVSGPLEPLWTAVPDPPSSATEFQASTLATRLAEARRDQVRYVSRVQPRLRALAVARLRERYPDLSSVDDERAVAFLGPFHALLSAPTAQAPDPARLAALLDRLEEA